MCQHKVWIPASHYRQQLASRQGRPCGWHWAHYVHTLPSKARSTLMVLPIMRPVFLMKVFMSGLTQAILSISNWPHFSLLTGHCDSGACTETLWCLHWDCVILILITPNNIHHPDTTPGCSNYPATSISMGNIQVLGIICHTYATSLAVVVPDQTSPAWQGRCAPCPKHIVLWQ